MSPKKKIRVGLIFGGESPEHEISVRSASTVFQLLDRKRYAVFPIGITTQGKWRTGQNAGEDLRAVLAKGRMFSPWTELPKTSDVVFPCLHGPLGEDGTIQGLCELLHLPYVGCGVLASALGMDKVVHKRLLRAQGIPVLASYDFEKWYWKKSEGEVFRKVQEEVGYPVFVKPACSGSSLGVSFARSELDLEKAIRKAFQQDEKVMVERAIPGAREFEIAVIGNQEPEASVAGETLSSNPFYDFQAKYEKPSGRRLPAEIPEILAGKMRNWAISAYQALDCKGFARVDFLAKPDLTEVVVGEINTIPGLTSASAFLKLWEAGGKAPKKILETLITLALNLHRSKVRP